MQDSLEDRINSLKNRLIKEVDINNLVDPSVIRLSEELDRVILEYQKISANKY